MQLPFELEQLSQAKNYQKWIYHAVEPYLGKRILELGAGIGNLSQWLPRRELLVLSEADEMLLGLLQKRFQSELLQNSHTVSVKKINLDIPLKNQLDEYHLDTIVSFNVMEHIQNDIEAFREQIETLKSSKTADPKRLVVFVPAHGFAFGSYDRLFQHYRRYDARQFKKIFQNLDPKLRVRTQYFNLLSLPAWVIKGRVFKDTQISPAQVRMLEKIIPLWAPIDNLIHQKLHLPLGQSLIGVVDGF